MKIVTRITLFLSMVVLFSTNAFAVKNNPATKQIATELAAATDSPEFATLNLESFLTMTPNQFEALTGKKLNLKETVQLKMAQKKAKKALKQKPAIDSSIYVILVILGWGFLAIGLNDDWQGSDWLVNLLLTVLCWLPGVIHGLSKRSKWY